MTKIVWNGCDSYIETEEDRLYHCAHEYEAFEVVVVPAPQYLGDEDLSGYFVTESGHFYKIV